MRDIAHADVGQFNDPAADRLLILFLTLESILANGFTDFVTWYVTGQLLPRLVPDTEHIRCATYTAYCERAHSTSVEHALWRLSELKA